MAYGNVWFHRNASISRFSRHREIPPLQTSKDLDNETKTQAGKGARAHFCEVGVKREKVRKKKMKLSCKSSLVTSLYSKHAVAATATVQSLLLTEFRPTEQTDLTFDGCILTNSLTKH